MEYIKQFKFSRVLLIVIMGCAVLTSCGNDDDGSEPVKSSEKEITSFVFGELTPPANGTISGNAIAVTVSDATDVTALKPTIAVSAGATISPASGVARDFSSPVTYTVTAEDGSTGTYTVTVTKENSQSNEAEITSFAFGGLTPPIDGIITNTAIAVSTPFDTDINALVPTIVISANATISPESGVAQDFSTPVQYTVTAQDGTTTTVYTVTVTPDPEPIIKITPVWEKTLKENGFPAWFTANNDRDISVSGDYAYVHNNNDKIRVISLLDGSDVSAGFDGDAANPNKEFINGKQNFASGNLFLLGTSTDSQGKIIASNFRAGSDALNPWNVYKWDSKDATQELLFAYPTPAGQNLGGNITVVGDVTADATVYAPGAGSNTILKFNISGGTPNIVPTIITLSDLVSLGNVPDVVPTSADADATLLITGTGVGGLAEYNQDGSLVSKLDDTVLNTGDTAPLFLYALDITAFEISGRKIIATTATDFTDGAADDGYLYIIDYTEGLDKVTADDIQRIAFTPNGNIDKNLNGTGGVDVLINGNEATVYAMITNFGIGAYKVTYE